MVGFPWLWNSDKWLRKKSQVKNFLQHSNLLGLVLISGYSRKDLDVICQELRILHQWHVSWAHGHKSPVTKLYNIYRLYYQTIYIVNWSIYTIGPSQSPKLWNIRRRHAQMVTKTARIPEKKKQTFHGYSGGPRLMSTAHFQQSLAQQRSSKECRSWETSPNPYLSLQEISRNPG